MMGVAVIRQFKAGETVVIVELADWSPITDVELGAGDVDGLNRN